MIGLSGGVDSAVAAYLLIKEGYEVIGGFMRNWDAIANNDIYGNPTLNDDCCPQEADYEDAKKVAESLGIPLFRIDFVKEYWDDVFQHFLEEYQKGRTPNPDIFCNKYVKFGAFLKFAREKGCDFIATGHYAKHHSQDGKILLAKAKDLNKDQTYFLSQINHEQIASCLFPLGEIEKKEVRKIAHELKLGVASKKDSTGICFIGERNFRNFLKNYIPAQSGEIRDIATGEVIGHHDGVLYYTIGQRKGMGIGGLKNHDSGSWFVCQKDVKNNILYVSSVHEKDYLLGDRVIVKNVNWLLKDKPQDFSPCLVKYRYRQSDLRIHLRFLDETTIEIINDAPYMAITPGQAAVFYNEDGIMLGGGIIEEVYYKGKLKP